MAYVAANSLQKHAAQVTVRAIPAPRPIDMQPPQGDATPQTHAWASLTG